MAMMSDVEMPLMAMRIQLASAVNLIVQVGRLQDGSRKITHVTEVLGFDQQTETYQAQDVFVRQYQGLGPKGEVLSRLVPSGLLPRCLEQVHEHGLELPSAMYDAAKQGPVQGTHG
jgi:pilus assembly protein CpaF